MTNRPNDRRPTKPPSMDDETFARLKAEAIAPYRGLRRFLYYSFAASGVVGGVIFFTQLLAGRDVAEALPNFGVQLAVVALMVWLIRLENKAERKQR
ncbi:MAG: DUF3493 domain-containing protein [Leptolyngbyaceae cyanobacterium bins.302]|nr:DUF3493 domain-containing protein [Leptolyngbyaceae cyanobacterium bins.302]